MATGITVEIKADVSGFKRDVKSALDAGSAQLRQFKSAIDSATSGFGSMRSALSDLKRAFVGLGAALILKEVAQTAIQAAINIDKTRQTIAALTGSVESANKKIAELRELAKSAPGVTTSFATDLFAQFKALKTVADTTINDLIKSIGRLNAVFNIPDIKTFSRNLIQIFQGGFERDQIKEALQSVPIFEQLLQEAFGTSDGQKLKKLKDAGKLTMETFLQGLITRINERFRDVQDGIGSLFDKLKDRVLVALEPLGSELTKILLPVFDDIVKKVEEYGTSAARVFAENRNDIISAAKEVTRLTIEVGKLIATLGEVAARSGIIKFLAIGAAATQDLLDGYIRKGPREKAVEDQFLILEGIRAAGDPRLSRPAATDEQVRRGSPFLSSTQTPAGGSPFLSSDSRTIVNEAAKTGAAVGARAGAAAAAGDAAARSRRAREVQDLFSNVRQREEPTLAERQRAIDDNMDRVFRAAVAGNSADRAEQLRQGRLSRAALTQAYEAREGALDASIVNTQRLARRGLNRSGQSIGDLINRGAVTPEQADALSQQANRAYADELRKILALEQQRGELRQDNIDNLEQEIELYDRLGSAISESERFMRGFNSATISLGDAFERFGQNVSQALLNTRDLLNGLKQSVLQFFNDLLGRSLQNLVSQALAPLAGAFGGGFGQPGFAGAGGGVFGNIFRTPGTFPGSVGSGAIQQLVSAAGGGISVPASVTQSATGIFANGAFARGLSGGGNATGIFANGQFAAGLAGGGAGGFLRGLGNSLAGAAPFLGAGIGSSLGGQSIFGQIAGAAGGFLGGGALAATLTTGVFSKAATAFLTNPFTIAAGAGLLIGSVLLGKAKQRRADEEASGQYLTQALQAIDQLAAGVGSGQISGSEARGIFDSQILGTFKSQISSLKTKSVVDSRLTNQVRDLQKVYDARIPPLIAEQERKAADARRFASIDSRLIPQFAGGGFVPGIDRGFDSVSILARPGELILNRQQQTAIQARAGGDIFRSVGVPNFNTTGRFEAGGYVGPMSSGQRGSDAPVTIYLTTNVDARGIYIAGATSEDGRKVDIKTDRDRRLNRER